MSLDVDPFDLVSAIEEAAGAAWDRPRLFLAGITTYRALPWANRAEIVTHWCWGLWASEAEARAGMEAILRPEYPASAGWQFGFAFAQHPLPAWLRAAIIDWLHEEEAEGAA